MFNKPAYFLNRELSWLKFNTRVLNEAKDKEKPLLERFKFISIASSNLDEFFMIRVAGLKHQFDSGIHKVDAAGFTVGKQLEEISKAVHEMSKLSCRYLKDLMQELEEQQDIVFVDAEGLSEKNREWIKKYFHHTVYPVVTPLAVDASHPFPFLANRTLNLAVILLNRDNDKLTAVIQVPSVLPRILEVPEGGRKRKFIFLEDIIKAYCDSFFCGYQIKDILPFRITRNADLLIEEDEAEDLLVQVEKSLRQRKHGQAVRLEIGRTKNKELKNFLLDELKIEPDDVYEVSGPLDATCLMKFADLPGYDHLRYKPLEPQLPEILGAEPDMFAVIREKDIRLHHPFHSFEPVIRFVQQAAADPQVLAIKQTLYRVSGNSPIVQALAQAAENGKQVTVLVELKARFDEERNILWARRLEEAGCHVIYGLVGVKTHAKIILVVRKEETGIKRYVHMGTGNYNDATARLYTDMGLFTANDQFGADASGFFNLLSGYSEPPMWNKIVVAPMGLRAKIIELIEREAAFARAGKPAHIIAKMNSLLDKEIITKLYEASAAGVKIELIIRGICVLRPGVENASENISVRSIIGRLLEHSRIFYFENGGDEKVYLSSADWMPRNLNDRVELFFPVEDNAHIAEIKEILNIMLRDNQKAYIMKKDGTYWKADKRGKEKINSQEVLYLKAQQEAYCRDMPLEQRMKPLYRKEG